MMIEEVQKRKEQFLTELKELMDRFGVEPHLTIDTENVFSTVEHPVLELWTERYSESFEVTNEDFM